MLLDKLFYKYAALNKGALSGKGKLVNYGAKGPVGIKTRPTLESSTDLKDTLAGKTKGVSGLGKGTESMYKPTVDNKTPSPGSIPITKSKKQVMTTD